MSAPQRHNGGEGFNRGMLVYLTLCSTLILALMIWQVARTGTL